MRVYVATVSRFLCVGKVAVTSLYRQGGAHTLHSAAVRQMFAWVPFVLFRAQFSRLNFDSGVVGRGFSVFACGFCLSLSLVVVVVVVVVSDMRDTTN